MKTALSATLLATTAIALGSLVGGCASVPPVSVEAYQCPYLYDDAYREDVDFNLLPTGEAGDDATTQKLVGSPAASPETMLNADPLASAMFEAMENREETAAEENAEQSPTPSVLLLSGGGQWGAFGAGFLERLQASQNPRDRIAPVIITGVSTGAIQSLFVAAGDYKGLLAAYTAHKEGEYVRMHKGLSPLWRGSRASMGPLRDLLMARLTGADGSTGLLDELAEKLKARGTLGHGQTRLFIGAVDAGSGKFVVFDIGRMIRDKMPRRDDPKFDTSYHQLAECVTAAALGSSSIPVNFGQTRVATRDGGWHVLYDGGVRQSVFYQRWMRSSRLAQKAFVQQQSTDKKDGKEPPRPLPIYVLRNGPSIARPGADGLQSPSLLSSAERGYSLIVNQTEVMSVCSLRLSDAQGPIYVQTADSIFSDPRFDGGTATNKWPPDGSFFDQTYMNALAQQGSRVAAEHPWLHLMPQGAGDDGDNCEISNGEQSSVTAAVEKNASGTH